MFDSIRKHQRILQFVLLLLIFPAFAFFGVSGYQRFLGDEDTVATVAGSTISRQQYDEALRRELERLRQMLGGQVDAALLDTPASRERVLDDLVTQRAMLAEASAQRVTVGDAHLRAAIAAIPGLRKPDGSFDQQRYSALVTGQGLTPAGFENEMRTELSMQVLPESIGASALVPRDVAERLVTLQEQTREVREVRLAPAEFAASVKPNDEQLRKFYDSNAKLFETPESARIEYVVLDADAVSSGITLTADELKAYYEQNKGRFGSPEQRRASHLLVKVEAGAKDDVRKAARSKAEGLAKQARSGDFAALAKANSQDAGSAVQGGDLGWFPRDAMVKPFSDAVWSMKDGDVSGVVESEFGFHVIKLTGVRAAAVKPFDQARPEIEAELRKAQASKRFGEAAGDFSNVVYEQADSLKPAAERFKLTVRSAEHVTRTVGDAKDKNSPLNNAKLLAAIFSADSIKTKRNTEAVEVGANRLVSARLVDYRAAQLKPFEAVAGEVRARVIEQEARRLAVAAGEARLKALREGAAATGLSAAKSLSRSSQSVVPNAAAEAIFRAPADKLPAYVGVDLGAQGYGVYQISKVTAPAADAIAARRSAYEQQIAQIAGREDLDAYVAALRERSKVRKYPERIITKAEPR